ARRGSVRWGAAGKPECPLAAARTRAELAKIVMHAQCAHLFMAHVLMAHVFMAHVFMAPALIARSRIAPPSPHLALGPACPLSPSAGPSLAQPLRPKAGTLLNAARNIQAPSTPRKPSR